jgi:alkanesulfonate monooxygenase SsuD/methylene tetrahydromethanopterin reductase-like flavin-dependent oxidoreductase (luciferase family)
VAILKENHMQTKPALSLAAVPGRRHALIDLAARLEEEGFEGVFSPSMGDALGFIGAIALKTSHIRLGTGIANIYMRHPFEYASAASSIHELSGGRFAFGIGVSHGPAHQRLRLNVGKPLADVRNFVEDYRAAADVGAGPLPPIVLATLRKRMVALSGEIADGCMWANGCRSHMPQSLEEVPAQKREGFFVGNIIPSCIDDDVRAAADVMRRSLVGYAYLPNYRNYWIEAGYGEEMRAIADAIAGGENDRVPSLMSERWLNDICLYGPLKKVREGVEAWYAAGVTTLILAPCSTKGGQLKAFEEMIEGFR